MTNIAAERRLLSTQGLQIETREDWGAAQKYTSDRRVDTPALGFFLHISVTIDGGDLPADEHAAMRTIESIGQQRFGIGFPYNAAAFDTGLLYEGQPLSRRGAHTVNNKGVAKYGPEDASLNYAYRALVLPQMEADDVTDAQIDAAARWAAAQIRAGLAVSGARWDLHRTVAWKACPGDNGAARLDDLNNLTTYYEANGLGEENDVLNDTDRAWLRKLVHDSEARQNTYVTTLLARQDDGVPVLVKGTGVYADGTRAPEGHAGKWWAISAEHAEYIQSRDRANTLIAAGQLVADANNQPFLWSQDRVDANLDVDQRPANPPAA